MKVKAIIPARYASTRLPGKPLAKIGNKSMIAHVYAAVHESGVADEVCVATDDKRIYEAIENIGGNVYMTSDKHQTGTERCAEVISDHPTDADVIINIQGDEPFLQPVHLSLLKSAFEENDVQIATLIKSIKDPEAIKQKSIIKVTRDINHNALYFSRSPIPCIRDEVEGQDFQFYKHIGIYAYRTETLKAIVNLKPTNLELAESLEQLRWLENAYKIRLKETVVESMSVDTAEDLEKARQIHKKQESSL